MTDTREPEERIRRRRCAWVNGCLRDAERGGYCVGHWEELYPQEPAEQEEA